jgi:hypothetical protein
MAKIQKTDEELKNVIFDRIGVKVTVRRDDARGWTATPFVSTPHTSADLAELDRLLVGLRAVYTLKSRSGAPLPASADRAKLSA